MPLAESPVTSGNEAKAGDDARSALEREVVAEWQDFTDNASMLYRQAIVEVRATV